MSKLTQLLTRLEEVTDELQEKNNTSLGYNKTLSFLLASKTKKVFIERYNQQIEEGYDAIEDLEFNPEAVTLEELKLLAVETVIEYTENQLECDDDFDNIDDDLEDDYDDLDDCTHKDYNDYDAENGGDDDSTRKTYDEDN